jgi:sarcosine oxidase
MSTSADVVIVGGGGIGSSVAYFLSLYQPHLRIVVFERDPTYSRASTALAAGGIRQMFSTEENILMSQFGYRFLEDAAEVLAVQGDRPALGVKPVPYLRLLPAGARSRVEEQVELQRHCGARPEFVEQPDLTRRFPWLNPEGVAFAVIGGGGEGVFDPLLLLHALCRKAIDQGAEFRTGEVTGFERGADGLITAVTLAGGATVECGRVVNAAGPRAGAVAALAGFELPVIPAKGHTYAFAPRRHVRELPVVFDHVSGFNFMPRADFYQASWPTQGQTRSADDFEADEGVFEQHVAGALTHRAPAFGAVTLLRSWVGHIELNTFDGNAVLGPHPECANFIFANGFSGHGGQHIPAAGRAIAELIAWGEYRAIDLSRFSYRRILENRPLHEAL